MPMFALDPLLVAYDGSEPSKAAAAYARALAARSGLTTTLMHVTDAGDSFWDLAPEHGTARGDAVRAMLDEEASKFTTPVETVDVDGEAASAIAAEAERRNVGLVATGTRGRGAVSRALFGSVAIGLMRTVDRPVLVVHEAFKAVQHVVVGVEGSALAQQGTALARSVCDATGASLTLAHVLTADRDFAAHAEAFGLPDGVWADALKATAERVFGPHRTSAGTGARERMLFGWAPDELRDLAKSLGAEMVVVGRKGKSQRGLDHIWSVGATLATKGPFATLIV